MNITTDWKDILSSEMKKPYYIELEKYLLEEYTNQTIYPPKYDIFTSLNLTSYCNTKIVILGQDPYHGKGQANGLSFSVEKENKIPPSLRNIYKEIEKEFDCNLFDKNGDLTAWANQGVLLLNSVLTVRDGEPTSHNGKGWEIFTDNIISLINEKNTPCVFILWGNFAKKKSTLITNPHHLILTAVHPSPLSASRGFFGCDHFKISNNFLVKSNQTAINWCV